MHRAFAPDRRTTDGVFRWGKPGLTAGPINL